MSLLGVKDKTVALFLPLPWRKVLLAGAVAVLEVGDYKTCMLNCVRYLDPCRNVYWI